MTLEYKLKSLILFHHIAFMFGLIFANLSWLWVSFIGFIIINTPKKPKITADHLQIPTTCFSIGIDKMVITKGVANESAVAVANSI